MKMYVSFLFLFVLWINIGSAQHKNILIDNYGGPNEPSIAINPKNPAQLVAGSNIKNVYYSSDTGRTWIETYLTSEYGVWGDPAITVDTNGYFYFFHLSNAQHWIDRIVSQRSEDGGRTWTQDTFMGLHGDKDQDKEWPVVDPRTNNIYVTWTQFDKYGSELSTDSTHILFSKSTDAGKTWSVAKRIDKVGGDCFDDDNTVEGAVPAVGPNGEVYVTWAGSQGLVFDKSLDEGETWLENDIIIGEFPGGWNYDIPGIGRCNGLPITVCDISGGDYNGTIYVNWTDQRNGVDDTDVWLTKSIDGGNTWSEPKRVNDDLPGRQQFLTWLTIDQTTGFLYFVFYDRRNYNNLKTDVYMAVSKDGGETFTNFRISESPFIPNKNVFFGDYNNITAHDNIVRPIWTRLENNKTSLWTAEIDIDSITTGINEPEFSKSLFEIYQNSPNPFTDKTAVKFKINHPSVVSLTIFDSIGNKVSDYIREAEYEMGEHVIPVDNEKLKLKPGLYLYSLRAGNIVKSIKVIISE